MTHICVGNLTIIGSDNGLSPGRRQAIIGTNVGILLTGPLGTNFSEILIGIQIFSFKKMPLKMSSAKWRPFCLGLNVLRRRICQWHRELALTRRSCRLVDKYEHFISYKLHTIVRFLEYNAALWPVHGLTRPILWATVLKSDLFVHDPAFHDAVIKWKHFPRYWPCVWAIHRSLVNSPHKGQWRGALMFSLICAWINGWANNREAGYLRR